MHAVDQIKKRILDYHVFLPEGKNFIPSYCGKQLPANLPLSYHSFLFVVHWVLVGKFYDFGRLQLEFSCMGPGLQHGHMRDKGAYARGQSSSASRRRERKEHSFGLDLKKQMRQRLQRKSHDTHKNT